MSYARKGPDSDPMPDPIETILRELRDELGSDGVSLAACHRAEELIQRAFDAGRQAESAARCAREPRSRACSFCGAKGVVPAAGDWRTCGNCDGYGRIEDSAR